jgi:hypothetical protein
MREFSEFEKKVLLKMVDLQNEGKLCRYYLLCGISKDLKVEEKDIYDIQIVSDSINKNEIRKILMQLSFLFIYLKDNYYLIDFRRDGKFKIELKKVPSKKYELVTDRTYPDEFFIYKYNCFFELLLSETIVDLVNNNFKTVEQRRFEIQMNDAQRKHEGSMSESKKQTKYSQWAFYVAIGALIVSLTSTIITQCSNNIRDEIRSIKTETPKLINQQIKNDTLKVNMIKK